MATALALDSNAIRMNSSVTGDLEHERDLVGRAQRGDLAAFETLYHGHAGRVFALCLRLTGDRQEASGLMQDAFVRAWERLDSFRGDAALATWLHRLTVNCFLEEARKTRRREARLTLHDDEEIGRRAQPGRPESGRTYDPQRASMRSHADTPTHGAGDFSHEVDVRLDLESALPQLPEGARRVFVLHDMYGYRHEEIAALLGIAAATVRVQLFRARRQLTEILDR